MSSGMGAFVVMQEIYAHFGVPTYPVRPDKKPAISHFQRVGLPGSRKLAEKFSDADAFGFVAGRRSKLTIIDIDSPDAGLVQAVYDRYGATPLQVLTPSGGRHLYYRHGGERRQVKRIHPSIDVLGSGAVIGIGSRVESGLYHIERGEIEDLARLPHLAVSVYGTPTARVFAPEEGRRNKELWRECMRQAGNCDSLAHLIKIAEKLNERCIPPMSDAELVDCARSAWKLEQSGDNWFGRHGAYLAKEDVTGPLWQDPYAMVLLMRIKALNRPDDEFWLADGFSRQLGWNVKRLRAARRKLLDDGYIELVREARRGQPALYRRTARRPKKET
jgi:Bifunctional DNA primase/polymerase, N-terminal